MTRAVPRLTAVAVALAVLAAGRAAAGPITYHVHINTASDPSIAPGQMGSLEFQYQSASGTPTDTTATVSSFVGGTPGAVASLASPLGSVSGSLLSPPIVLSDNGPPLNDLVENFTYGKSIDFGVTLSQGMPAGGNGASFALVLWNLPDGPANPSLLQMQQLAAPGFLNDPNNGGPGTAVIIDNGGPFPGPQASLAAVTVSVPQAASVPEPGTLMLLGLGGAGLIGWRRRVARGGRQAQR